MCFLVSPEKQLSWKGYYWAVTNIKTYIMNIKTYIMNTLFQIVPNSNSQQFTLSIKKRKKNTNKEKQTQEQILTQDGGRR